MGVLRAMWKIEDSDLNIGNWVRGQSRDILANDAFCPCLETLPRATLKAIRLISLAERV